MSTKGPPLRPTAWRRRVILCGWLLATVVIAVRSAQIQLVQGRVWSALAEAQHTTDKAVAAARGTIYDRDGAELAVSRETWTVSIAPRELSNPRLVSELLKETLGLSDRKARQLVSSGRRWSVVPGRFPASVKMRLGGVRGLYVERVLERYHPHGDLARGVLGSVVDEAGQGGIEQILDELLRGRAGREVVARDNRGRPIPGETFTVEAPRSGGQAVLTLDLDLQEIARQALEDAIDESQAYGGDVLVTDPVSGEILAMVSMRDGNATGLGAVTSPYEPGSTLKPFTVATLLESELATLDDRFEVGDGTWKAPGRVLHDAHRPEEPFISLADALRVSSNVGIARAAQSLPPGIQYEALRDFGFGVLTGVELPGEVSGTLRRPDEWSGSSPASLAIGYEISVTPLQMAMAYGALANGGILMEPRLVREIRDSNGRTLHRWGPRVLRRVVSPEVARAVGEVLVDVVKDGTGTAASLGVFSVAGKSGTARAYSPEGGYLRGDYSSSFVGFFPAEDPQLVVFVKLDRPQAGSYYGGAVAAPVTRATMEAALAARSTPLNRAQLLRATRGSAPPTSSAAPSVRFASTVLDSPTPDVSESLVLPARPEPGVAVSLPDVAGLPARVAIRRLHALGLRVEQHVLGEIVGTVPSAGTRVFQGDTVRLRVFRRSDD
jgi:cell division protein FtsI (penicillin-binding protein 3)